MRHQQDERVARDREDVEGEKGAAMSPAINEDTARIGIDSAEQSPERIEKADNENGRAECLEIFRDKTHPELFSGADDERGNEQDDEVALEGEEIGNPAPEIHESRLLHFMGRMIYRNRAATIGFILWEEA